MITFTFYDKKHYFGKKMYICRMVKINKNNLKQKNSASKPN